MAWEIKQTVILNIGVCSYQGVRWYGSETQLAPTWAISSVSWLQITLRVVENWWDLPQPSHAKLIGTDSSLTQNTFLNKAFARRVVCEMIRDRRTRIYIGIFFLPLCCQCCVSASLLNLCLMSLWRTVGVTTPARLMLIFFQFFSPWILWKCLFKMVKISCWDIRCSS